MLQGGFVFSMHLKAPFNFKGVSFRNHGKTQLAEKDLLAKTTGPLILDRPMIPPKLRVPKTRNFSPGRRKIGAVGLEVRKSLVGKTGKSAHLQTKKMKIWHLLICPGTNSEGLSKVGSSGDDRSLLLVEDLW